MFIKKKEYNRLIEELERVENLYFGLIDEKHALCKERKKVLKSNLKLSSPTYQREIATKIFDDLERYGVYDNGMYHFILGSFVYQTIKNKYIPEPSEPCTECKHFVGCEQAVWTKQCEEFEKGTENEQQIL